VYDRRRAVRLGSVRVPAWFWTDSGSVRGGFGAASGPVRGGFGAGALPGSRPGARPVRDPMV